jgi:hypothetical protein
MFFLQKEMERLDLPMERVVRLQRSLGDATVALPGFPTQRTTAYLCVWRGGKGVRLAVVLHLKISGRLAFYLNEEGEVGKRQAQRILDAAIYFAESMGFMLNDMEIAHLPPEERAALWQALPLRQGAPPPAEPPAPAMPPLLPAYAAPATDQPQAAGWRLHPPSSGDLEQGRQKILENLGRFLASL